jgi:hypothetical protein
VGETDLGIAEAGRGQFLQVLGAGQHARDGPDERAAFAAFGWGQVVLGDDVAAYTPPGVPNATASPTSPSSTTRARVNSSSNSVSELRP